MCLEVDSTVEVWSLYMYFFPYDLALGWKYMLHILGVCVCGIQGNESQPRYSLSPPLACICSSTLSLLLPFMHIYVQE